MSWLELGLAASMLWPAGPQASLSGEAPHSSLCPCPLPSPFPCRSLQVSRLQGELARLQHEMDAKLAAVQSMSQHSALRQASAQAHAAVHDN